MQGRRLLVRPVPADHVAGRRQFPHEIGWAEGVALSAASHWRRACSDVRNLSGVTGEATGHSRPGADGDAVPGLAVTWVKASRPGDQPGMPDQVRLKKSVSCVYQETCFVAVSHSSCSTSSVLISSWTS